MSSASELLDKLMGRSRNMTETEKAVHKIHFSDANVCKFYLAGLSPYALLKGTKSDLGPYESIEDAECKKAWDALEQSEKDRYGYERELLNLLTTLIAKCDRKISMNRGRIATQTQAEVREWQKRVEAMAPAEQLRLAEIAAAMPKLVEEIDRLGRNGEVDDALAAVGRLEALTGERAALRLRLGPLPGTSKRLVLCDVSGNFLSSNDLSEQLISHFGGKQYQAWKRMRAKHRELLRRQPPRGTEKYYSSGFRGVKPAAGGTRGRSREVEQRGGSGSGSHGRRDGRSRSRSRSDGRSRSRSRSHSRGDDRDRRHRDSRREDYHRRDDRRDDWRRDRPDSRGRAGGSRRR